MKNFPDPYPHLFSPITIKKTTFKNRIISSPHSGIIFADPVSRQINDVGIQYYGNRARGGAGVVTTMESMIDWESGSAHCAQFNLVDDTTMGTLKRFTRYIHFFGAKASAEITHRGNYSVPAYCRGNEPGGPSDVTLPDGQHVHELTEEELMRLVRLFAAAAKRAKDAEFDMLCIHGGHGWLLNQFLSPAENFRTDQYGGSLENRARFPIMVVDAIREAVGPDFVIEYRVSCDEMCENGLTLDEVIPFVRMIENKIDIIHCSVGSKVNILTRGYQTPNRFRELGCNVKYAEAMKKAGVKCYVTAVGGISTPECAEEIIASGKADFVAMVRPFIADDDWAEKARAGKAEDIRPCIKCARCLDERGEKKRVTCAVNPAHGHEDLLEKYLNKTAPTRTIAVVGGGPAGMQAALTAAQTGHKVTLFEKTDRLGGLLRYADGVEFKRYLREYREWLIRQVRKSAVDVRLNTEATPELLDKGYYDAIIVAVGSEPVIPPIPGVDGENVMWAGTAIEQLDQLGDRIVVVGGGGVGAETALHLAQQGRQVTVLEMTEELCRDLPTTERRETILLLKEQATVLLNTKCIRILPKEVTVRGQDGEDRFIPADNVVLSAGLKSRAGERDSFLRHAYDVIPVGDCVQPGTVYTATHDGFYAILAINNRNVYP